MLLFLVHLDKHSIFDAKRVVLDDGDGAELLKLSKKKKWMSFPSNILFVRSFYEDFYDNHIGKYKEDYGLVVLGTPGIGKSAFGSYCVYRGLKDGKTVVYQTMDGAMRVYTSDSVTWVDHTTNVFGLLDEPDTLYVVDYGPPLHASCLTVLVAPLMRDKWKGFAKRDGTDIRYFGVYSVEEMHLLRKYCFPKVPEEIMLQQMRMWGGVPRACLSQHDKPQWTEDALENLVRSENVAVLDKARDLTKTDSTDDPCHCIVHIKRTEDFLDGGRNIASPHMSDVLGRVLYNEHEDRFRQWLSSENKSIAFSVISDVFSSLFKRFAVKEFAAGGEFETHQIEITSDEDKCVSRPNSGGKLVTYRPLTLTLTLTRPVETGLRGMPRDDGACNVMPFENDNAMDALVHGAKVVRGLKMPELKFSFLVPALRAPEFKTLSPGRFKWPAGCSLSTDERLVAKNKWSFQDIVIPYQQPCQQRRATAHVDQTRNVIMPEKEENPKKLKKKEKKLKKLKKKKKEKEETQQDDVTKKRKRGRQSKEILERYKRQKWTT
jgi:hypothetical protein